MIHNYFPDENKDNLFVVSGIQDNRGSMYFGSQNLIDYDGGYRQLKKN
jgi:hypothetical protein